MAEHVCVKTRVSRSSFFFPAAVRTYVASHRSAAAALLDALAWVARKNRKPWRAGGCARALPKQPPTHTHTRTPGISAERRPVAEGAGLQAI
jgi:hypothetical protein